MEKNKYPRILGLYASAALLLLSACSKDSETANSDAWSEPQTVSTDTVEAAKPRLAVNDGGTVIAVWQQVATEERANTLLDQTHADTVAFANHGNHNHFDVYARTDIWVRHYDPTADAWTTPKKLQDGDWVKVQAIERDATSNEVTATSNVGVITDTEPMVVTDGQGNAMAVWQQREQFVVDANNNVSRPVSHVWAARFNGGTGQWGTPAELDQAVASTAATGIAVGDPITARAPTIAMNANGHAVAAWLQWNDTDSDSDGHADYVYNVYASRYTADVGWGLPELLSEAHLQAGTPCAAIDTNGNRLVAWRQWDATDDPPNTTYHKFRVYARRYNTGITQWDAIAAVSSASSTTANPDGQAEELAIAMNGDGEATAVWSEWDSEGSTATKPKHNLHIYAGRFVPADGWGVPQRISIVGTESDKVVTAVQPDVDIDADGNAVAVWIQYTQGFTVTTSGSTYTSTNTSLESTARGVWSNRFDAGNLAWASAQALESGTRQDSDQPRVAMTGTGATVVWLQRSAPLENSAFNIRGRSYSNAEGWGAKELISDGASDSLDLDLAVNADGSTWVAWHRLSGQESVIQASRYQP